MTPTSAKPQLSAITIIYFSLIGILTVFSLVVFYLNATGGISPPDAELATTMRYVMLVIVPAGLLAGHFIYKSKLASIDPSLSLKEKFGSYQVAILLRSACFEAPGLLGGVVALLTTDNSFLLFTAAIIVAFLFLRPTAFSITTDLHLNSKEHAQLEG